MKRAILILLVIVIVLSLCPCGGTAVSEPTPKPERVPENMLENVSEPSAELVATPKEEFYGEWVNYETGDTLTIDSQSLVLKSADGSSITLDWLLTQIVGDTLVDIFNYYLGLTLTVANGQKQLIGDRATYISVEEANQRWDSESFSLGETAETALAKITIKKIEFSERVGSDIAPKLFISERGTLSAPKDMTYALVYFDLTNLSKEQMSVGNDTTMTIDYNNGYEYNTNDGDAWLFEDAGNGSIYGYYGLLIGGYVVQLSSLMSNSYIACIPVPKTVADDTDAPLKIVIEIGNSFDRDHSVVRYAVDRDGKAQNKPQETLSSDEISEILESHSWIRTISDSESAIISFASDGAGSMSFTDGDYYDLTWKVRSNGTVDVTLIIDGKDAPGVYDFIEKDGQYLIVMTDNSDYSYIAQ